MILFHSDIQDGCFSVISKIFFLGTTFVIKLLHDMKVSFLTLWKVCAYFYCQLENKYGCHWRGKFQHRTIYFKVFHLWNHWIIWNMKCSLDCPFAKYMSLCISEIQDGHSWRTKFWHRTILVHVIEIYLFSENLIQSKLYVNYHWMVPLNFFVWIGNSRWPPLHNKFNERLYGIHILKLQHLT